MNRVGSTSSIEVRAPIEAVWNVLADVQAWSAWAPRVEVLRITTVRPQMAFDWKLNGITIKAVFDVVDPPHELSWRGRFFAYRALDRNVLDALDGRRTRVTFEESLEGPLVRLLYRPSQLRANHERWLQALKQAVEAPRKRP